MFWPVSYAADFFFAMQEKIIFPIVILIQSFMIDSMLWCLSPFKEIK